MRSMETVKLKEQFVKKLNEAIEAYGLTDSELGRRMGTSRQFVGQYRDITTAPTPGLDLVEKFSNAIGLDNPLMLLDESEIPQVVT